MASFFISYASGDAYVRRQPEQAAEVKAIGCFDNVLTFGPDDLSKSFKKKNRKLLDYKHGAGLWLWKPQILLQVFRHHAQAGDIVFYCDVDHRFDHDPTVFLEAATETEILLFHEDGNIAKDCTYPATFSHMGLVSYDYTDTTMLLAGYHVWRVGVRAVSFVREWLHWCCDSNVMLPGRVKHEQFGSLPTEQYAIESVLKWDGVMQRPAPCHCFDQSILTLLAKKRGIAPVRSPKLDNYLSEVPLSAG